MEVWFIHFRKYIKQTYWSIIFYFCSIILFKIGLTEVDFVFFENLFWQISLLIMLNDCLLHLQIASQFGKNTIRSCGFISI